MPIVPSKSPKTAMRRALSIEPRERIGNQSEAENVSAKYSGGPKRSAAAPRPRGEKHQPHEPESSGDEGARAAIPVGPARPAGHLITIETGNHGSRLARKCDQNGSGGATNIAP